MILTNNSIFPSTILWQGRLETSRVQLKKSDRLLITDENLQNLLDREWQEMQEYTNANKGILFNGDCYSIREFNYDEKGKFLNFTLMVTDFKTRQGLHRLHFKNIDTNEVFANGFAISGLITTSDNYYVVAKMSNKTVNINKYDLIGGVCDIKTALTYSGLINKYYEELDEEIGIKQHQILDSKYVYVIDTPEKTHSLLVRTRLAISRQEIQDLFNRTDIDHELEELVFVRADDFADFIRENLPRYKGIANNSFL
jgi:hypothetical protein